MTREDAWRSLHSSCLPYFAHACISSSKSPAEIITSGIMCNSFKQNSFIFSSAIGDFIHKTTIYQKVNLGQPFSFQCPDHNPNYGATYSWVGDRNIQFLRNRRRGVSPDGNLLFAYVTKKDISEISDSNGIRCKISGANSFRESGTLWLQESDEQLGEVFVRACACVHVRACACVSETVGGSPKKPFAYVRFHNRDSIHHEDLMSPNCRLS